MAAYGKGDNMAEPTKTVSGNLISPSCRRLHLSISVGPDI